MTPDDLRKARRALDLTQVEMSKALRVDERKYRAWESGVAMPGPAVVAVHYMLRHGLIEGLIDNGVLTWRSP